MNNFITVMFLIFLIGCGTESSLQGVGGSSAIESTQSGGGRNPKVLCGDTECQFDNAFAACLNDECVIEDCLNGFEDCNGLSKDGCEVNTANDPLNCGSCTNQCYPEGATAVCSGGSCGCQLDDDNKCECTSPNFSDCDNDRKNGCEVDLTSNEANCGTCGNVCGASSECVEDSYQVEIGICDCSAFEGDGIISQNQQLNDCGACLEKKCCVELLACDEDSNCEFWYKDLRAYIMVGGSDLSDPWDFANQSLDFILECGKSNCPECGIP